MLEGLEAWWLCVLDFLWCCWILEVGCWWLCAVQFDDTTGFYKLDAASFLVDEAASFSVGAATSF
jgi:hypothetical protein